MQMEKIDRQQIFEHAKDWVLEAGQVIKDSINKPRTIETKSNPNDLVTEMDKKIEVFLVDKIKNTYPSDQILGEEGYGDELNSLKGRVWIIDPIDGTMNFVHQARNFAISIGVYEDGVGEIGLIYDVMADNLYHAKRSEGAFKNDKQLPKLSLELKFEEAILGLNHYFLTENRVVDEKMMHQLVRTVRGNRTYGSAALEFAYVAEGVIDSYLSMRLAPWDVAGGMVIAKEVGGVITTLDGDSLDLLGNNTVLVSNPAIHDKILAVIKAGRK